MSQPCAICTSIGIYIKIIKAIPTEAEYAQLAVERMKALVKDMTEAHQNAITDHSEFKFPILSMEVCPVHIVTTVIVPGFFSPDTRMRDHDRVIETLIGFTIGSAVLAVYKEIFEPQLRAAELEVVG